MLCRAVPQAGPISEALYTMDYSIVNETNFLTALGSVRYAPEPFEGALSGRGWVSGRVGGRAGGLVGR
jgi:hypothetical protein